MYNFKYTPITLYILVPSFIILMEFIMCTNALYVHGPAYDKRHVYYFAYMICITYHDTSVLNLDQLFYAAM